MVGELAMGRFRLIERLGAGGMGTVYRALDERLQREVAVKEIEGADTRRVLREAKAAARLNHPAIVTLYEFGSDGRRALLVSELACGEPLDVLSADAAISDREVGLVGASVCAALAHAHERGVVHRDVKPQNVVVDLDAEPPRAKLMDFGIASIAGEAPLTAAGEVVGTLAYMSPEQAEGERATEASDVYSLALMLYESWAGHNPVAGATPAATVRRIGTCLPSLADSRPDLPEPLIAAIDDCLEPDAAARPELDELAEVIESALDELDDAHAVPGRDEAARPGVSLHAATLLRPDRLRARPRGARRAGEPAGPRACPGGPRPARRGPRRAPGARPSAPARRANGRHLARHRLSGACGPRPLGPRARRPGRPGLAVARRRFADARARPRAAVRRAGAR